MFAKAQIGQGLIGIENSAMRSGKSRMNSIPRWLIFTLIGLEYCWRIALVDSAVEEFIAAVTLDHQNRGVAAQLLAEQQASRAFYAPPTITMS